MDTVLANAAVKLVEEKATAYLRCEPKDLRVNLFRQGGGNFARVCLINGGAFESTCSGASLLEALVSLADHLDRMQHERMRKDVFRETLRAAGIKEPA